jgi:hypothetical protein
MYDSISQLIVALFLIAYLLVFAALPWWGLGPRLLGVLKKGFALASARARKTIRFWLVQLKRRELKSRAAARVVTVRPLRSTTGGASS